MIIAIDFDGTCTTHEFPKIGKEIGAPRVLKKLVKSGHKLILYTMRCDFLGNETLSGSPTGSNKPLMYLRDAVNWFKKHKIPLYGIQVNPTQHTWTISPKCYAELYIDDAALGVPLKYDPNISEKVFVDWNKVEKLLIKKEIIKTKPNTPRLAFDTLL